MKTTKRKLAAGPLVAWLASAAIAALGCASSPDTETPSVATASPAPAAFSPGDVTGPFTWGAATRVTHLRHLWFADQPDEAGFAAAKAEGVTLVIDLRAPTERDWDERAVVEGLGLAYANVPVTGDAFDPAAFARIEALVQAQQGAPTLIHCSTSNRAGAWLAAHLVEAHGLSRDDALAIGRRAGITNEKIVERLDAYLDAR